MAKGKGFAGMRSRSMGGSYGRSNPTKDLYSMSEVDATQVPLANFGYERVGKPFIARRSSFSWSRKSSKQHQDTDELEAQPSAVPPSPPVQRTPAHKSSKFGIKGFFAGILDSYKKLLQSAEASSVQLSDLYPSNSMVAPVTPAAGTRGIKYISPSPGVGRRSLGRIAEESSRER